MVNRHQPRDAQRRARSINGRGKPLEKLYDLYSFKFIPFMGKLVAKDEDSYRYLAESIRMHPSQEELADMFRESGFDRVEYFNLAAGVVAVHRGFKM